MEPQKTPFSPPEGAASNPQTNPSDTSPVGDVSAGQNGPTAPALPTEPTTTPDQGSFGSESTAGVVVGQTIQPGISSATGTDNVSSSVPGSAPAPAATSPFSGMSADNVPPAPLPVSPPRSHKRKILLAVIIAAVVLLLGAGAAAYYLVANKPENVLKQALANAVDDTKTKTVHFSGAFGVTESSNMEMAATFKGQTNAETGAFDLSASLDALVATITLDMRSTDGKVFYLRAGGLEGLSQLLAGTGNASAAMYAPLITSLNDQWVEVNESLTNQLGSNAVGDVELSDADRQILADTYDKHAFLVIKETLPDEAIKGTDSYHYRVVIDPTELKRFVAALRAANFNDLKNNMSENQLKELNKQIDDATFGKYPFDLWISKSDKMITQATLKILQDGSTLDLRFTVDSYNKPVNVEKPADAKSLLELLGNAAGAHLNAGLPVSQLGNGISL